MDGKNNTETAVHFPPWKSTAYALYLHADASDFSELSQGERTALLSAFDADYDEAIDRFFTED